MLKKRLSVLFSMIMVITLLTLNVFAESVGFTDMPNDWSTPALEEAIKNGLLTGSGGKIMPGENLTRAQMATIINRAFGAERTVSISRFTDVKTTDWFYQEMAKAVAMKTFQGSGDKLNPNNPITREEAFVVISRALNLESISRKPTGFTDLVDISTWAKESVYALINNGYIKGSNGKINPKGYITRAEFAQVMNNIIEKYINKSGEYSEEVIGNLMINTKDVTIKDSIIKGDLIIGDGVGTGEVILDNVEVTGRLLVRGGGKDSIIIKGNSVIGSITISKVNGVVRVYTEEGVEVGEVVVDGNDDVILEGVFSNIAIKSDNITVRVNNSDIDEIKIEGSISRLIVSGESNIDKIIANGSDLVVEGEGKVSEVAANGNNILVNTQGTKVIAAKGTEGVYAGDKEVGSGESAVVGEEVITGGGIVMPPIIIGGGGGGTIVPPVISVTGITLDRIEVTLEVGESITLLASILPSNATNKNVIWSTSEANIATVSNGLVTGIAEGEANIVARTQDGSFIATCIVKVLTVPSEPDGTKTVEGKLYASNYSRNISKYALTREYFDLVLMYRTGEPFDNGSVTFNLPTEFAITGEDLVSFSSGSPYFKVSELVENVEVRDNGKKLILSNITKNRIDDVLLILKNRNTISAGSYDFSAMGDKDGKGNAFIPTSGIEDEKVEFSILEGKSIKGMLSLPNEMMAPTGGLDVNIITRNSSYNNDYYHHNMRLTIPENSNSISYDIRVLPNDEYRISYEISNNYVFLKNGYYNPNGTVAKGAESESIFIMNNDIENINMQLVEGNLLQGIVKLPNDEVAENQLWVHFNIFDNEGYYLNTEAIIVENQNLAEFKAVVPNGEFYIQYSIGEDNPYVKSGYYSDEGTVSNINEANRVTLNSNNIDVGVVELIKGNKVTGTISLPENYVNSEGMQVYLNYYSDNGNFGKNVYINQNQLASSYEIYLPNGEYKLEYRTYSSAFINRGYYTSSGTVFNDFEAEVIIVDNNQVENIDIDLLLGNKLSGVIKLPNNEVAETDIWINFNIYDGQGNNFYSQTKIEENQNSVLLSAVVPNGEYYIQYSIG